MKGKEGQGGKEKKKREPSLTEYLLHARYLVSVFSFRLLSWSPGP